MQTNFGNGHVIQILHSGITWNACKNEIYIVL